MTGPRGGDPFEGLRERKLICVATENYEHLGWLKGVPDEVRVISDWLTDESLADRRFTITHPKLSHDPGKTDVITTLGQKGWLSHEDAAVVYITGHGLKINGKHYTAFHHTELGKASTAMNTAELIDYILDTESEHLLVLVDLCYAGATAGDVGGLDVVPPDRVLLLGSATTGDPANVAGLTAAIEGFLDHVRSDEGQKYTERYFTVEQFITAVDERLPRNQRLSWLHPAVAKMTWHPCLPNPRWRPESPPLVDPRREGVALRLEDLASHWDPRSRGTTEGGDPGWLFTGRRELMMQLIAAATGGPGVLVVTGGAGSGKSAALARLVTLCDPGFRTTHADRLTSIPAELLPPPLCVDVALLAKGRTPDETLGELIDLLRIPTPSGRVGRADLLTAVRRWLADLPEPVTVVVDAVDESADPPELVTKILEELLGGEAGTRIRLLLGVRSPTRGDPDSQADAKLHMLCQLAAGLPAARSIAVDEEPWWNPADLSDYAARVLTFNPGSPYNTPGADPTQVAAKLAGRANRSFLITRLAAASLAQREHPVSPTDDSWLSAVDEGVVGVFRQDLHQELPDPEDRMRALHLLRALAFSHGRGLPWYRIWAVVANAVADDPTQYPTGQPPTYGDKDIAWLMGTRLAGYLVTDREDDTTVYRLFHQKLTDVLTEQWDELLTPPQPPTPHHSDTPGPAR